jgi:hypothetical protein
LKIFLLGITGMKYFEELSENSIFINCAIHLHAADRFCTGYSVCH